MEDETEKCAEIIYEVWEENVRELLKQFRFETAQARRGQVQGPKRLDIYFTPLITKNSYKWDRDEFGVKDSIEALMELYLEGNSPVWASWQEYQKEYNERRNWGNLRGEDIHTHFIPDKIIIEMLNRLGKETKYERNKFNEFGELYSLEKNERTFSYDINDKDKEKVFYEVLIHEISHYVLKLFCEKRGHSYPSEIGEAIGWFLDHKLYEENTYHTAADVDVNDIDIGTFSNYSFSKQDKNYVVWLINALNFSFGVDKKNNKAKHPYPWAVSFISLIVQENELIKKKIFTELLPRKTKENIEELEEIIETGYRQEYSDLVETVQSTEKKINEIKNQANSKGDNNRELYERKKFYEEMNDLKRTIESRIGLEEPQKFERFVEEKIDESANQKQPFKETVEKMEEEITRHVEEQMKRIDEAIRLCKDKEKEMSEREVGEIDGEKIMERKQFIDRIWGLNRIKEKLEDKLDRIEHRFYVYQKNNH